MIVVAGDEKLAASAVFSSDKAGAGVGELKKVHVTSSPSARTIVTDAPFTDVDPVDCCAKEQLIRSKSQPIAAFSVIV